MSNTDIKPFTPHYINQARLFDIYSILNRGYSTFEEISVSNVESSKNEVKGRANGSGNFLRLFSLSIGVEGSREKESGAQSASTINKVQTVASILGNVKEQMRDKGYLKSNLDNPRLGDFIDIPCTLKLNSLRKAFDVFEDIVGLSLAFNNNGNNKKPNSKSSGNANNGTSDKLPSKKEIESMRKSLALFMGDSEVLCETKEYALLSNISEQNLYYSGLEDILNTDVRCFAQIKRIHPDGASLLRNTTLARIKNPDMKQEFLGDLLLLFENDDFDFDVDCKSEIIGKPVYELEIISLCITNLEGTE